MSCGSVCVRSLLVCAFSMMVVGSDVGGACMDQRCAEREHLAMVVFLRLNNGAVRASSRKGRLAGRERHGCAGAGMGCQNVQARWVANVRA